MKQAQSDSGAFRTNYWWAKKVFMLSIHAQDDLEISNHIFKYEILYQIYIKTFSINALLFFILNINKGKEWFNPFMNHTFCSIKMIIAILSVLLIGLLYHHDKVTKNKKIMIACKEILLLSCFIDSHFHVFLFLVNKFGFNLKME